VFQGFCERSTIEASKPAIQIVDDRPIYEEQLVEAFVDSKKGTTQLLVSAASFPAREPRRAGLGSRGAASFPTGGTNQRENNPAGSRGLGNNEEAVDATY